jgi:5-methylthioadenosine/S-adenosylhomocysteine deaminase
VPADQRADLLVENGLVITMDSQRRILNPGYVAVLDKKIVHVGAGSPVGYATVERINAAGAVVLPGRGNAHNHLELCLERGGTDEERQSRDILLRLARGLTRERARVAARLTLLEQVRYGITTTHESHWTHYHPDSTDGICDAIVESGMRAIVARSICDNELTPPEFCERADDVMRDLDRLAATYDSDRLQIISEPTTMLRCTAETSVAMHHWAVERRKIWHIHLAQDRAELEDALATVGCGSVQYAQRLGVLGPDMLAAHCSGLLDEEVALLGEYTVRVAHCPLTIIRGGGLVPPIWDLEKRGAIVGLGTDGSGTNNGQNLWESMKLAIYMQRVRFANRYLGSAEQALELATIKAARALGMDNQVGSLEPGKWADITVVPLNQPHLLPEARLLNNLVYSGCSTYAQTVIVGGKVLVRDGRSTVFDEANVMAEAREAQIQIISEAGLEAHLPLSRIWPVHAHGHAHTGPQVSGADC